jgi:hypothetical protein
MKIKNGSVAKYQALKLLKEGNTQMETAQRVGVSQTTVSKWYNEFVNGKMNLIHLYNPNQF